MNNHVIIWESRPRKFTLHLTPEVFEYITELVENDSPHWSPAGKEAKRLMDEITVAIASGPNNG